MFLKEAVPSLVASLTQSSFDGTWIIDTNTMQFPQKPTEYFLSNGMFRCSNCDANVELKADGHDQKVSETGYSDTKSVQPWMHTR